MTNFKSSRALHTAHYLYKKRIEQSTALIAYDPRKELSICLKRAWYFERFRNWLRNGVVTFTYTKLDGSLREAKGTLNDLLIPTDKLPKGTSAAKPNFASVAYYDLERQDWRAFNVAEFVGFIDIYRLEQIQGKAQKRKEAKEKTMQVYSD